MGIFTRFRDIVSANINAMLDKAEDPEKMIKLMIHEMEDTLIELKSACAGVIAGRKKIERRLDAAALKVALWSERAELAVSKQKDNLAREALLEKRRYKEQEDSLIAERGEFDDLVDKYHQDIEELETKLGKAKEKKRLLAQRHKRATTKKRAEQEIRRSTSAETMARFDKLESRIEQMEAEAELVNPKRAGASEDPFADLAADEEIETELARLKAAQNSQQQDGSKE